MALPNQAWEKDGDEPPLPVLQQTSQRILFLYIRSPARFTGGSPTKRMALGDNRFD